MDSDLLQIARLFNHPDLAGYYQHFSKDIIKGITNPEAQALYEIWEQIEAKTTHPALASLEAEIFKKIGKHDKRVRLTTGDYITISPIKTFKTLAQLNSLQEKLIHETKTEAEQNFRQWLERVVIQTGAFGEPSTLAQLDPLSLSLQTLEKLRNTPAYASSDQEEITFPLASHAIERKPKTPIGILPFDEIELEGGAEEDTILIISGESNIGKSHLGLFCLSSLSLRRETVLLCSGEDSIETTRKRIFAHYLRKPTKEVLEMSEQDRCDLMRSLYGHEDDPTSLHHHIIRNVAITCIKEGNFTPQKVREKIDIAEQKTQKKVKAFMCDYLQKMDENPTKQKTRHMRDEELENTVNQLKDLCQEKKTLGIVISQVPSHAAGGLQEFLNLKQAVARSYAATWGAHYIVTMNRTIEETKRLAGASQDKNPRLNLFLCKNKDGPLGVCYAVGFLNQARWEFFRNKIELERELESRKIYEEAQKPKNFP